MKIYEQTELDFKDVLVKPKRSFINSRSEVEITREYKFKWCPRKIVGTGIISANMATVGTFEVAKHMMKNKMFCCLHKHYPVEDLIKFITENDCRDYVFLSMGLRDEDYEKIETILTKYPDKCRNICIDVPNAYIPRVKDLIIKMREKFPDILLMVGNAVTAELVEDLILSTHQVRYGELFKYITVESLLSSRDKNKILKKNNSKINISELGQTVKFNGNLEHDYFSLIQFYFQGEVLRYELLSEKLKENPNNSRIRKESAAKRH